jgi:hypothetical protein
MRFTTAKISEYVAAVQSDGFCIIPSHFPRSLLQKWHEAFLVVLEQRIADKTASPRGPHRYYTSLLFVEPWADPTIFEDDDILRIVESLGGGDVVMPELAVDTPLEGSDFQVIHRDAPQKSEHLPDLDAREAFQFAVNFPLVDVTLENGPVEMIRGTHTLSDEDAKQMVKSGEAAARLEPLLMKLGDVMIRDVRTLHRGTPNFTNQPRPMVVVGYNRRQHLRPQLRIFVPRETHDQLSPRAMRMLDINPVVESLAEAQQAELYSDLNFLNPY